MREFIKVDAGIQRVVRNPGNRVPPGRQAGIGPVFGYLADHIIDPEVRFVFGRNLERNTSFRFERIGAVFSQLKHRR